MGRITLLVDTYRKESQLLHQSLIKAGFDCVAFSVLYDGFLPDGISCPYAYYTGAMQSGEVEKPRYFDRLQVPAFWDIRANNSEGEVFDFDRRRARIFFAEPKHKRYIKIVDWMDENGTVRWSDHYDKFGRRFAQTLLDTNQKLIMKTYYDERNREVITENFVTGNIILNEKGKVYVFDSKIDFMVHFLKKMHAPMERIFYNSLSTPFFVSERLGSQEKISGSDILFWQEPIGSEIPGNMKGILARTSVRTKRVLVQSRAAYERMLKLNAPEQVIGSLGYIYPFARENEGKKSVLILTNSDQVEQLDTLAKALPDVRFYVAAITEMSQKLLTMAKYGNVTPIENVTEQRAEALYQKCDFYLDINHGGEIMDAVYRAFLHNQLIFSFGKTLHNRSYVAPENIYQLSQIGELVEKLRSAMTNEGYRKEQLEAQRSYAMAETMEQYQITLDDL